ncbi:MAG: hypothetical protein NC082_03850 [Clostridiales bacterium]|nr:hypothetical protein [Clostridiales bacterium]
MKKILEIILSLISGLTFPLLMPTYAMLLVFSVTFLKFLPGRSMLYVDLVTFAATVMIPIITIYIFNVQGKIKDVLLNERSDRTIPYIVTTLSYVAIALYLWHYGAPAWMIAFMVGAAIVLGAMLFINMRWKISGHAAGMGGLTALVLFIVYKGYCTIPGVTLPCIIVLLSGLVCTCRLLLGRHNLSQVIAGYFLSLGVIYGSMMVSVAGN